MTSPWFSAYLAPWFSLLSLLSLGSILQVYVERGQHRRLVTAALAGGAVLGGILLLLTFIAVAVGQPHYVVIALGVSGFIVGAVCFAELMIVRRQYTEVELRRVAAKEI